MKNLVKFIAFSCILGFVASKSIRAAGTDYCSLCDDHIACNNDGKFSPTCSEDASNVKITPTLQNEILDLHNQLRNMVAKGELKGFEPAARMAYLQWDAELAHLAKLNTRRCKFAHDECHKTNRFDSPGQNIFFLGNSDQYLDPVIVIKNSTTGWFDENKDANMEQIKKLVLPGQNPPQILHFTQIVRDKSDRIGCAISRYQEGGWYKNYFVCNYAVTNILDQAIYTPGQPTSGCMSGIHEEYDGLCSGNEDYESA